MGSAYDYGRNTSLRVFHNYQKPKPFIFYTYHVETNPDDLHGAVMLIEGERFDSLDRLIEKSEWLGWTPFVVLPPHFDGIIIVTRMHNFNPLEASIPAAVVMKIHFKVKSIL